MVTCYQFMLVCGKYKIYSNKVVKYLVTLLVTYLSHLTQYVSRNKANYFIMLPASFMRTARFWCNIAAYMVNLCVDRVLFSLSLLSVGY